MVIFHLRDEESFLKNNELSYCAGDDKRSMAASHFSAYFFEGAKGKPEARDKQSTKSQKHVTCGVKVAIPSARDAKL